jgi:hypothetical protein
MAEARRPRYRLSVNPVLEDRLESAAAQMGMPPNQVAYMCLGLGLNMLEQLVNVQAAIMANPELLRLALNQQKASAEADSILAGAREQ